VIKMLSKNIGSTDRMVRAIGGGGLAIVELTGNLGGFEEIFHYFAIGTAIWLIATATSGNCPTYSLIGISTCSSELDEEE
tara:strand:- start:155 stop:394 length:240 start_codon:yes stop_codon:yes gene_type:complete